MLSIGYGLTTVTPDEGDGETEGGLAGLNIDLGTYLTPDLALFVTLGGTSFTLETAFGDFDYYNGFGGVVAQYWVNPQLAVGGGAGFGVFLITQGDEGNSEKGPAITGRASYRFAGSWQGMLAITPSFYDGGTVTSTSFLVAYQWD